MFGQQKNSTGSGISDPQNPNKQNNLSIENIPIHTMKEDLAATNPSLAPKAKTIPVVPKNPESTPINPSDQKTSPFLSENSSWDSQPVKETQKPLPEREHPSPFKPEANKGNVIPVRPPVKTPYPLPDTNAPSSKNPSQKKPDLTIIGLSALAVCFFLAISWFGYRYFTKTDEPKPTPVTEEQPGPTTPVRSFSEESPNYLRIENSAPGNQEAKQLLQSTSLKVKTENYQLPIEFIPTNQQNSPLTFSEFSLILGLSLPTNILENTGPGSFSLYFFNDSADKNNTGQAKIGFSISIKDSALMRNLLLAEEINLANQLSPLFFTTSYQKDKLFGSSTYKTTEIRFSNIISPEKLSIDYTILESKLLIGTTKATIRALIDKLDISNQFPLSQQTPQPNLPD